MKKIELVNYFNKLYPFDNQEDWDNCGIDCKTNLTDDITGILVSLDISSQVVNEALRLNCNVIITHHPILISDNNNLIGNTNKNQIKFLKTHKILHLSLHTCFDRDKFGTSYQIAKFICKKIPLQIDENIKHQYLIFCKLKKEISFKKFLKKLKSVKEINSIRYPNASKKIIRTICIGGGSCSSMLNDVINKCDCFLTGDVKWHNYLDALNNDLIMIDINHDAENIFNNVIANQCKKIFNEEKVFISKCQMKIINYKN